MVEKLISTEADELSIDIVDTESSSPPLGGNGKTSKSGPSTPGSCRFSRFLSSTNSISLTSECERKSFVPAVTNHWWHVTQT